LIATDAPAEAVDRPYRSTGCWNVRCRIRLRAGEADLDQPLRGTVGADAASVAEGEHLGERVRDRAQSTEDVLGAGVIDLDRGGVDDDRRR
jgi:hypothetical protein